METKLYTRADVNARKEAEKESGETDPISATITGDWTERKIYQMWIAVLQGFALSAYGKMKRERSEKT